MTNTHTHPFNLKKAPLLDMANRMLQLMHRQGDPTQVTVAGWSCFCLLDPSALAPLMSQCSGPTKINEWAASMSAWTWPYILDMALHSVRLSFPPAIRHRRVLNRVSVFGFIMLSLSLLSKRGLIHCYLFEGTFNLHPLCPGHCWIGKTVPTVATTTHVYSLLVKEAERLCHHVDGIIGEGWGILKDTETLKKIIITSVPQMSGLSWDRHVGTSSLCCQQCGPCVYKELWFSSENHRPLWVPWPVKLRLSPWQRIITKTCWMAKQKSDPQNASHTFSKQKAPVFNPASTTTNAKRFSNTYCILYL